MSDALDVRPIGPDLEEALAEFFQAFHENGDDRLFHPHPFTAEEARRRAQYQGQDLYVAVLEEDRMVGYGMLRGWDEGYPIPSLGIGVLPDARRHGIGRALMHALHAAAAERGATAIRLTVYPDNLPARRLYDSLGYQVAGEERGMLVAFLRLQSETTPSNQPAEQMV